METLFTLFLVNIAAVRTISPTFANALEYILDKMENEWSQNKFERSQYEQAIEDERTWSRSRSDLVETLRSQVLDLKDDVKRFTNILPLNAMWYVLIPATWVKHNPVHAIRILRDVFAASGKGQLGLKEAVNFRNDIIAQEHDLFVGQPLTTLEMLAAVTALEELGRPWSDVTISYCYQENNKPTKQDDDAPTSATALHAILAVAEAADLPDLPGLDASEWPLPSLRTNSDDHDN
jgi:hypothetical protein